MARIFETVTVALVLVVSLSHARHLNSIEEEVVTQEPEIPEMPEMKCMKIMPGLRSAFGYRCITPDNSTDAANLRQPPQWFFNDEPIHEGDKYMMVMRKYEGYYAANAEGNWEKMPLMDVSLVIADVNEDDVGEYYMKMDMDGVTMEKTMMLPAALACGNHPACFEDNCSWPARLTCKSNPEAYCQMDMCGRNNWCMPRWFVGAKEVTCDEIDEQYYVPMH